MTALSHVHFKLFTLEMLTSSGFAAIQVKLIQYYTNVKTSVLRDFYQDCPAGQKFKITSTANKIVVIPCILDNFSKWPNYKLSSFIRTDQGEMKVRGKNT